MLVLNWGWLVTFGGSTCDVLSRVDTDGPADVRQEADLALGVAARQSSVCHSKWI